MSQATAPRPSPQGRLFVPPPPRWCGTKAPLERPRNAGYVALVRARLAARREGRAS